MAAPVSRLTLLRQVRGFFGIGSNSAVPSCLAEPKPLMTELAPTPNIPRTWRNNGLVFSHYSP